LKLRTVFFRSNWILESKFFLLSSPSTNTEFVRKQPAATKFSYCWIRSHVKQARFHGVYPSALGPPALFTLHLNFGKTLWFNSTVTRRCVKKRTGWNQLGFGSATPSKHFG
jgi:hypothetical protein